MLPSRTVLVVEDDEDVRNYLKLLLTQNRWSVIPAKSGTEALALLAQTTFTLILCDLDLGRGPSGLDVLGRLPAMNQGRPFVILTGHASAARCREAFLLGATDFLEKPMTPTALLSSLEQSLASGAECELDNVLVPEAALAPENSAGASHVRRALDAIVRRYAETDLTIADVAREVGITPEHLSRLFKSHLGCSPLDRLHEIRTDRAEELLQTTRLSVYEVAYACGYRATSELGRWFRRLRGRTPSEARMRAGMVI